jgi:predicted amidohydrolase
MRSAKISVCQMAAAPVKSFQELEQQVLTLMDQVPSDADYVLFPELCSIGLLSSIPDLASPSLENLGEISVYTGQIKELFRGIAKNRRQTIIAGSHMESEGGRLYNTCYIFTEDGTCYSHRKTHLFPGERVSGTLEGDTFTVLDIGPAKIGIAICYEAEIPEISHILSVKGAEIIFCPSLTFSEHGFWRVRHCLQARCIENQVYAVHCPTVGDIGIPDLKTFGKASILSPCDTPWTPNGVIAEADPNTQTVITGLVNLDILHENRQSGSATTYKDRQRRKDLYLHYSPYDLHEKQL